MKAIKGKPFFRGVKLAGHKAPTENLPVERAEPRGDVAIPTRQQHQFRHQKQDTQ